MAPTFPNPFARNNLQAPPHVPEPSHPLTPNRTRGRKRIDYPATQSPSIIDIVFAAAFHEGEGTVSITQKQMTVDIGQNDREKLDWLKARFGGKVYGPYIGSAGNDIYHWITVRERALGFMFTIFTFLSKGRRAQFKAVLEGKAKSYKRAYQPTISDDGISEEFVRRNIERSIKRQRANPMSLFGVKR